MKLGTVLLCFALAGAPTAHAADLYVQDFETTTGYSSSTQFKSSDGSDFFIRTDGSDLGANIAYGQSDNFFFAGQDIDTGIAGPAFLTSDAFSIAGSTMLQFSVDLAEDDLDSGFAQSWDLGDSVRFEYMVDGGEWQEIFTASGTADNTAARIDGREIKGSFETFTADLTGVTGDFMTIRLVWDLDANGEDLAVDNIRVTGQRVAVVPLPPAAFAGLAMLGALGIARGLRR